jgi:uncharacterized membrane protein
MGFGLLAAIGWFGISPMSLALAGGFMLVAPAMLTGFFRIALTLEQGGETRFVQPFAAFFRAPPPIWMVAVFCAFLFLIWLTDAGVLYSVLVGSEYLPYELPWLVRPDERVLTFWLWSSLMGSVLAFMIFTVSAFSVPLLFERRATLVAAISASVRAVFKNFMPCMTWALILTGAIIGAIVLLPLLLAVLPVLAYASFALYRAVFPLAET